LKNEVGFSCANLEILNDINGEVSEACVYSIHASNVAMSVINKKIKTRYP